MPTTTNEQPQAAAALVPLPWPGTLPQCVQDWQEQNEPVTIRTQMEGGPPKVRRRYSAPIRRIAVQMILPDDSQYLTLRDFFDSALSGGVGYFTFSHPWSGEQLTMRFVDPPKYEPLGFLAINVSMTWEILP